MVIIDDLRALNGPQRAAFTPSLLGWALDAFDYFLLVFVLTDIANEFHADIALVNSALLLTLAARPVGAFVFGRLADRYGRRPMLMTVVRPLFGPGAGLGLLAQRLRLPAGLRSLFGFAMGGVWGVGASLALETIPAKSRGVISGILQEGYPMGYFLAAIANLFLPAIGWRGMLALGVLPALLILYIQRPCARRPAWEAARSGGGAPRPSFIQAMKGHWRLLAYAVLLMTCFNFFSHGTQDLYPQFLQEQHSFAAADGHRPDRRLQRRRHPGRAPLRPALGADRPPPGHRPGRAAGAADHPAVGLLATARCCWRPARS